MELLKISKVHALDLLIYLLRFNTTNLKRVSVLVNHHHLELHTILTHHERLHAVLRLL